MDRILESGIRARVLALTDTEPRLTESLARSAHEAGYDFVTSALAEEFKKKLDAKDPAVVLVDSGHKSAESTCIALRQNPAHSNVAILVMSKNPGDLAFAEAFSWGADDVVPWSPEWPLVTRLRAAPSVAPPASAGRGIALVVASEPARRIVVGRVLRRAGYAIVFAGDASEVRAAVEQHTARLVVFDTDAGSSKDAIEATRSLASPPAFVVRCPPKDIAAERALEREGAVAVIDSFLPPETVLYRANELVRGGHNEDRKSPRLLYGTRVEFRPAGRDEREIGFSYNVSRGGLYVRTLAPPASDLVWLELTPPRADRAVRLDGQIVWRRGLANADAATAPPGFGVKLAGASPTDLESWQAGCAAFEAAGG